MAPLSRPGVADERAVGGGATVLQMLVHGSNTSTIEMTGSLVPMTIPPITYKRPFNTATAGSLRAAGIGGRADQV